MTIPDLHDLNYVIADPTGNITAIVESPVEPHRQPAVAARLMERHPQVEQVGFISPGPIPSLRMAGGEFCGNASMCAAALIRKQEQSEYKGQPGQERVVIYVSGVPDPVEVDLTRKGQDCFLAGIHMPRALGIKELEFRYGPLCDLLPLVHMGGIAHIIIEQTSPFASLQKDPTAAEAAIRAWGEELDMPGLGMMFLREKKLSQEESGDSSLYYHLRPLVYIPGSGTLFWEHSCASGSAAVGVYLATKQGSLIDLTLKEPGGCLRVRSDPDKGETWLYGQVRFL